MNPELKKDDRVILIKMSDPYSPVPPMTGGVVISSSKVFGDILYYVNWDNGQKLNLISGEDIWMLEDDFKRKRKPKKDITESHMVDTVMKNKQLIKNYRFKTILKYLAAIRATGIVNMLQASFFLTCGRERLEDFVKYLKVSNKKSLKYAIENADEIRTLMIGGAMKMVEEKGKEVTLQSVQRQMEFDANRLMELYMTLPRTDEFDFDDELDDEEDYYDEDYEEDDEEDDDY
jgi:hypothetical protein